MPKLSKEERAELEARLAEDDADDGADDEVEVGHKDGGYFRGSYRRAVALGYITEPAPKSEDEGKGKGGQQGGTVKRFSGRRVS